jgi:hypothetical protein
MQGDKGVPKSHPTVELWGMDGWAKSEDNQLLLEYLVKRSIEDS